MDTLLALIGGITLFTLMNKREGFEQTYLDSESYAKQDTSAAENKKINTFSPSEKPDLQSNQPFVDYFSLGSDKQQENQADWIKRNSLYNTNLINGIPIKDYYEKYSKEVLDNGTWYLNKNMPQGTNQYQEDSMVQEKMEIFTGLQQKRDRAMLGVQNKK